jgi:hypothetical protein
VGRKIRRRKRSYRQFIEGKITGAEFPIDAPDSAEVERLRGALTRINILADPYRESGAWASPEAYSRWAAQIASDALNG